MARFKLDENLPDEVAAILRASGHDTATVKEEGLGGGDDQHLIEICNRENRALMTLDVGFGDIRTYPPKDYPGIVVLRLSKQDKGSASAAVRDILGMLGRESLARLLWVVEPGRVRIHD